MTDSIMALAGLATPMAVRVAATLRLAELAETWTGVEDLARRTGTSLPVLRALLDHLATVGVFDVDGDSYRVTDLGGQLRGPLRHHLDVTSSAGRADLAFVELAHTVTTGGSGYERRYGKEFWADLAEEPTLRESFDAQMRGRFADKAPEIARRFDWGRFADIVDVGGGDGTLLSHILGAHAGPRGLLLDLRSTAATATKTFAEAGLTGRATAVAGSFFDPLPAAADAYVLSDILHNWDDDAARAILAGCAQAIVQDGSVLVIGVLRDGPGFSPWIALAMAVIFGGRERSTAEVAALAAECGLTLRGLTQVADDRTLLEFGFTS